MNNTKKSKKLLIVATTLMIIALASVLTVYAAVYLGTFTGQTVTVGGVVTGTIKYSNTTGDVGGNWQSTLQIASTSTPWYTKADLSAGYSGRVEISWQLQSDSTGSWQNVGTLVTTTEVLTGAGQAVYAGQDWSASGYATTAGSYRVTVVVNSAPL